MKPSPSLLLAALAGLSTLVACALLPIRSERGRVPEPAAQSAAPPVSAPAPRAAPSAAPLDCPADLSLAATRTISTRLATGMEPGPYRRMTWAPGHRSSPGKDFLWSERDAVERVIAIEAAHPEIVPAGFRSEIQARPRDPALRLRMARCELRVAAVRRRASHDAALALLLGSSLDEVKDVLIRSTHDEDGPVTSCAVAPCGKGLVCEPTERSCRTLEAIVLAFVSSDDLDLEDALSRAIFARYVQSASPPSSPLGGFLTARVHRCGAEICSFREYEHQGRTELVRWDLRDGGTVETYPCKRTPEMLASVASQKLCRSKTGHWSQELCVYACGQNRQGEACRSGCYQHCKTEASLFYDCNPGLH